MTTYYRIIDPATKQRVSNDTTDIESAVRVCASMCKAQPDAHYTVKPIRKDS